MDLERRLRRVAGHPYRALVTDLDGTLLDPSGRVTDRTVRALTAARAAGVRIAAASARPLRLVEEVLGDHLRLFDAVLVSNGASTLSVPDRCVLDEALIARPDAVALIARVRRTWPQAGFGWEVGPRFEHDVVFARIAGRRAIVRGLEGAPRPRPDGAVHQIVVAWPDGRPAERLGALRQVCAAAADGTVVTDSAGGVAELSAHGADKAAAMRRWAALGGFSGADVIAIGDQVNDLTMLSAAGLGVAMGNAVPAVRAAAGAVTLPNTEDGVAAAVETLLLGG